MHFIARFMKVICTLAFIFTFNFGIVILLIRFGVLPNTRVLLVTTSMTTMRHQYIAKIVSSNSDIEKIMNSNKVDYDTENSDSSSVMVLLSDIKYQEINYSENSIDPRRKLPSRLKDTVELIKISGDGYKGHMFIVSNPKRIKLVATKSLGKYGTKLNDLINENDGIGGINAGGFADEGGVGNGGIPTGVIIANGEIKYAQKNQSIYSLVGFDRRGVLVLGNYNLEQIKSLNIEQGISFYPFLVVNGKPTTIVGDGGWGINPRTAIGQRADGAVLMLVLDGRQTSSVGATIKELQRLMIEHGAVNATNLDGGSSTVMYYENKLINKPCSPYGERPLPSAFIITKPE